MGGMPELISPDARAVLRRMQAAYDGVSTLIVTGRQVVTTTCTNGTWQSQATAFTVHYKAPARFRYESGDTVWEGTVGPEQQMLRRVLSAKLVHVSNGTRVYLYQRNEEPQQYGGNTYWEAALPAGKLPPPGRSREFALGIGWDIVRLAASEGGVAGWIGDAKGVERLPDEAIDGRTFVALGTVSGWPRRNEETIYVDPETYHLRRVVQRPHTPPNSIARNSIVRDYAETRIDPPVNDAVFDWTPPPDARPDPFAAR